MYKENTVQPDIALSERILDKPFPDFKHDSEKEISQNQAHLDPNTVLDLKKLLSWYEDLASVMPETDSADHNGEGSSPDLDPKLLDNEQLVEESQRIVDSINLLISSFVHRVNMIGQSVDSESFGAVIADCIPIMMEIVDQQHALKKLTKIQPELIEAYERKKLSEANLESRQDLFDQSSRLYESISAKQAQIGQITKSVAKLLVNKLGIRSELAVLKQELSDLGAEKTRLKSIADELNSPKPMASLAYSQLLLLKKGLDTLLQGSVALIEAQINSLLNQVPNHETSPEPIPSTDLATLTDILITKYAGSELQSLPVELQAKIRAVLYQVAMQGVVVNKLYNGSDSELAENQRLMDRGMELRAQIENLKEEIANRDANLWGLIDCLDRFQSLSYSIHQLFQAWNQVAHQFSGVNSNQKDASQLLPILEWLVYLPGPWYSPDYSQLYNCKYQLAELCNPTQIYKLNHEVGLDCFEVYRDSPQFVAKARPEEVQEISQYLANNTAQNLLSQTSNYDTDFDLGRNLLHFYDPQSVLINVLNAFKNSDEYFLNPVTYNGQSRLYKYLSSLDDKTLAAVKDLGMPHLDEIIATVLSHPDGGMRRRIADEHPLIMADNPVYSELDLQLAQLGTHILQSKDSSMTLFVIKLLDKLYQADISGAYPLLEEMYMTQSADVQQAILRLALDRLSVSPSLAQFLLTVYPKLDPKTQDQLKEYGTKLFEACIVTDLSEIQLQSISILLNKAVEEVKQIIQFVLDTKQEVENFEYVANYFDSYCQLAKHTGIPKLLGALSEYGSYPIHQDSETLILVLSEQDAILTKIRKISQYFPDYRYFFYKNYEYNPASGEAQTPYYYDPYACLIRQMKLENIFAVLHSQITPDSQLDSELVSGIYQSLDVSAKADGVQTGALDQEKINSFTQALTVFTKAVQDPKHPASKQSEFYYHLSSLRIVASHPEYVEELLSLAVDGYLEDSKLTDFYLANLEKLLSVPRKKRADYVQVLDQIAHSPSQEIQRTKDQLLDQLLQTDDPIQDYANIESIFIRNNLPTVGKIFKVFEILYPKALVSGMLKPDKSSPYLVNSGPNKRMVTFYNDLIKIHIRSGNRSLKHYIQSMMDGLSILEALDERGLQSLLPDQLLQLSAFFQTLATLRENSTLGREKSVPYEATQALQPSELVSEIRNLINSLELEPGQTFSERLSEMFLQSAGVSSLEDCLGTMAATKRVAHQRGLDIVQGPNQVGLQLKAGDLIKGVDYKYFPAMMQNGFLAKEFLGGNSSSDSTPFDTDLSMVMQADVEQGFVGAMNYSLARGYGQMYVVLKDRGQLQLTTSNSVQEYDPEKLELFQAAVAVPRHYGIRTGFAATEVEFVILSNLLVANQLELEKLYYEVAKNGYYIPLVDQTGQLIFTPDMYAEYRKIFDGVGQFEGDQIQFQPTVKGDLHYQWLQKVIEKRGESDQMVEQINTELQNLVANILEQEGIKLKQKYDHGLLGAELLSIGSTGRHTNKVGDYDFDYTLMLDDVDLDKVSRIVAKINAQLKPSQDESHFEFRPRYYQLRAMGCAGIVGVPDIDIGIKAKSELAVYGSHNAVADKLQSIYQTYGVEAYEQVIGNIILAKQLLSEGGAYKRVEHGGFGGIGVENWILANQGNLAVACHTFWEAGHQDGQLLSFDQFVKRYKIMDAGINVKKSFHDNYIQKMNANGYEAMMQVIERYFIKGEKQDQDS